MSAAPLCFSCMAAAAKEMGAAGEETSAFEMVLPPPRAGARNAPHNRADMESAPTKMRPPKNPHRRYLHDFDLLPLQPLPPGLRR